MKINHFSLLLALLLSMISTTALAYDACIDGIYYNFSGTEATVTYQSFNDFTNTSNYTGDIVIPESVTYNGTTYSVTSIDKEAFQNSRSLNSITIPNSLISIGNGAFSGCRALTSITIPNSVTSIGDNAFMFCTSLTSISIPNGVTEIRYAVFRECTSLTSIIIPNSVTSIGGSAFYGCTGLTSITIPISVVSIGTGAFYGCNGLTSVIVDSNNTIYDSRNDCNAIIETASNVLTLGCKNTIIPKNVTEIGDEAFINCIGLTSITIPNSVVSIGNRAFYWCHNLASVTVGNRITSIGSSSFNLCKIRNLQVKSKTPPSSSTDSFSEQTQYHTILYIPMGAWDAYAYNNAWYKFINIRETATTQEEATSTNAYTLMDTKSFSYAVYDPVNGNIRMVSSVTVDESDPNHCWQTITVDGQQYLYNLGAKKFAVPSTDGSSFTLSDGVGNITVADGENGLIINGHSEAQWAMVLNDRMGTDSELEETITAVKGIENTSHSIRDIYDLSGRQQTKSAKGINIMRFSDGSTKKVLNK